MQPRNTDKNRTAQIRFTRRRRRIILFAGATAPPNLVQIGQLCEPAHAHRVMCSRPVMRAQPDTSVEVSVSPVGIGGFPDGRSAPILLKT